jgi:hypothetical protein
LAFIVGSLNNSLPRFSKECQSLLCELRRFT